MLFARNWCVQHYSRAWDQCSSCSSDQCQVANVIFDSCPHGSRLTARNTSHTCGNGDDRDYGEQPRVDVVFYPTHKDAARDYGEFVGERGNYSVPTRWAWISLPVKVKTNILHFPFSVFSAANQACKSSPGELTDQHARKESATDFLCSSQAAQKTSSAIFRGECFIGASLMTLTLTYSTIAVLQCTQCSA